MKKYKQFVNEKMEYDKINNQINNLLKHFINQKFKFQYEQIIWKSHNSNYPEIDVADFIFKGVSLEPIWDLHTEKLIDVFFNITFIDRYNKEVIVYFDKKSPTDKKLDLEYANPWDKNYSTILHGNYKDKTKIDYDDPKSYPNKADYMDLVPSEYRTTELLGELKGILQQSNEQIKTKNK